MALPLNRVMHNELILIFHHAHRYPQFHRTAGFAFGDPAGVRLKDRKHFLILPNLFVFQQPALHLLQLPPGMFEIPLKVDTSSCNRYRHSIVPPLGQGPARRAP